MFYVKDQISILNIGSLRINNISLTKSTNNYSTIISLMTR
jgi:hypothetical protein